MPASPPTQRYNPGPPSDQSHSQYVHSPPPSQEEHTMLVSRTRANYMTHGVANGSIGGGYGPYSRASAPQTTTRFSNMSNASGFSEKVSQPTTPATPAPKLSPPKTNTVGYLWDAKDPDLDDALHNPDPVRDAILDRRWTLFSFRGWMNIGCLVVILVALITLFAGYPIALWYRTTHPTGPGYNLGGINGTGQIPVLNIPRLIDTDTPQDAYYRTGFDGESYTLVFSDEFNTNGRSFYPGDDPYWEAVNLHYWLTADLEWYQEDTVTTRDGNLVITLSEQPTHGLNFRSGMIQSWNKFCFTTGYIEVNMSLPGDPRVPGLWPAAWTMGNLARIGYGATTDGLWPFSYDSCDVGTFPNQTRKDGTPQAATGGLSYQPGQRLSACTCPGSDHPGPSVNKGRGAPEIDIIEAETNLATLRGSASQSLQLAPYNAGYQYIEADTYVYNSTGTNLNSYKGGTYQQAVSALTDIGITAYNRSGFQTYGFEYWSNPKNRGEGFVTWASGGKPTWTLTAAAIGPDPKTEINSRLISEEPM
ncbi:hypothetical protein FRB99_001709, partial [Tulasnella sp. 403]